MFIVTWDGDGGDGCADLGVAGVAEEFGEEVFDGDYSHCRCASADVNAVARCLDKPALRTAVARIDGDIRVIVVTQGLSDDDLVFRYGILIPVCCNRKRNTAGFHILIEQNHTVNIAGIRIVSPDNRISRCAFAENGQRRKLGRVVCAGIEKQYAEQKKKTEKKMT